MKNFGFVRCGVTSFAGTVADCEKNADIILSICENSKAVDLLVFPELSLTSSTCGDLFFTEVLLLGAKKALLGLVKKTTHFNTVIAVGLPLKLNNVLYSVEAILHRGKILGIVPLKNDLSEFAEFSGNTKNCSEYFNFNYDIPFGNLIFSETSFPFNFGFNGVDANIILQPECLPTYAGNERTLLKKYFSKKESVTVLHSNTGIGESSGENIFIGECGIYSHGKTLYTSSFLDSLHNEPDVFNSYVLGISDVDVELGRKCAGVDCTENIISFSLLSEKSYTQNDLIFPVSASPFLPATDGLSDLEKKFKLNSFFNEIIHLQALGLAKRITHIGCKKALLGVSGGIDSTFALLVTAIAFDILHIPRKNIFAITMPCFGTTSQTKTNAQKLAELLECSFEEIDIKNTVLSHFKDIGQKTDSYDTAFENAQARERTQVLMDKANKIGGIVIGGSDLSEIALGWSTFNGDHISMYNLNSSLPKSILRQCLKYCADTSEQFVKHNYEAFANVINSVLNTPISPELLPSENDSIVQKTEEVLGEYELHDFILYHTMVNNFAPDKICFLAEVAFSGKYSHSEIKKTAKLFYKRFFQNQFKRSCAPEGLAVLPLSLSVRSSWKMPSDSACKLWLNYFND